MSAVVLGGVVRPLKVESPGALYHITLQGNTGQPIFLDDRDRLYQG